MRFRKITFQNYRCFMNGTIEFTEDNDRNITLLVGPNGSGKTETLYAFSWVLYDFDFSSLRGKESTPYAINAKLHREIEKARVNTTASCSVELEFESNGIVYLITKTCEYKRVSHGVSAKEYQTLSNYTPTHELSLPIRDPDIIQRRLTQILPAEILKGIIFDGERMQKLSSTDAQATTAIKGVISDITNVELLEKADLYFGKIKRQLVKQLSKMSKQSGNSILSDLISQLSAAETDFQNTKKRLEQSKEELDTCNAKKAELSQELLANTQAKELELKRQNEDRNLHRYEQERDELYKDFSATLKNGYFLISSKLLDDVDAIIQTYDVPKDLTVSAVESILTRDKCICGRCLDENAVKTLRALISILPPDNINSMLSEVIRMMREHAKDVSSQASSIYRKINDCEREIKTCTETITMLSTEISQLKDGQDASAAARKEAALQQYTKRAAVLEVEIPSLELSVDSLEVKIRDLTAKRDAKAKYHTEQYTLDKKLQFIAKCTKGLALIREINKASALREINHKISAAYISLSEDAALGRCIHIVQFDETHKYQIIVYLRASYLRLVNEWKSDGTWEHYKTCGYSTEEIEEIAMLRNVDANSTGQGKMNTLSFVKAILDYSSAQKSDEGIEISKEYPLIIDSPFGDIAGENLSHASSQLHTFTNQIILMLDNDRYESLAKNLNPNISNIYRFEKTDSKNESRIIMQGGI